jgi:biopolymer transport protein ExbD
MQFRRASAPQATINIAPLVDVVFLLVIFFAVSTTFLETAGMKLELPTSSASAERQPRELTVLLGSDGRISFDGEEIDREGLADRLRAALGERERKLVVLRADREARHGDVVGLMDLIRDAGAEAMTIAARPAGAS